MCKIQAARPLLEECDYEPIGDYAIIGDCRSAALVSRTGSIDWLCLPDFSSPSVFAALLDRRRGGRFMLRPRHIGRIERRYLGETAILETTFHCAGGILRLTDFMPLAFDDRKPQRLARLAECLAGEIDLDALYQPCPEYACRSPLLQSCGETGWSYRQDGSTVLLQSDFGLAAAGGGILAGSARLQAGQACRFLFVVAPGGSAPDDGLAAMPAQLATTRSWWQAWSRQCKYRGPYAEAVVRSCLTLKLLSHHASGAVVAALTTSLPESLSAGRNWDYRYAWLRDTSLLLQSFSDLGYAQESQALLAWLLQVECSPRLLPLYDLAGRPVADERILPQFEGYRGRGPVRVGNAARRRLQLDIYGEVVQTAYRHVARHGQLEAEEKERLAGLGRAVCELWRQPDQGIWEVRTPARHHTHSKLMCWVALDRLIALGQRMTLRVDQIVLRRERERLRQAIEREGYHPEIGSYVGYFGGTDPDASLLLMLRYGYADPRSPRLRSTYRYIVERLGLGDGLFYRYPPGGGYDGVAGEDHPYAACSYWAVDYLARAGELEEATRLFERLLGLANDVGLYGEEIDARSQAPAGNFPLAFTHSGLVTAALAIAQAEQGRRGHQIAA